MTTERQHRLYSPSQADDFFICAMRQRAQAAAPKEPESPYALEGTQAHEVLQAALENGVRDAKTAHLEYSTLFMYDLDDGRNEFYLAIDAALAHIYDLLDEHPDNVLYVENFVDIPITSYPGQAGGFCDVGVYVPSERLLHIIDYKHGAGIAKSAETRQMKGYGAGFLYGDVSTVEVTDGSCGSLIDPDTVDTVELWIVQPRAFHAAGPIRSHKMTPFQLYEYIDELDARIAYCESDQAEYKPDTDACRFCGARFTCPALEEKAMQVANASFKQIGDFTSTLLPEPSDLDLKRLGAIRFHAPLLRSWLKACEDMAYQKARQGAHIPGAKMVYTQDKREYYGDELDIAANIGALCGPDFDVTSLYELKLVPLTTAEKLVVEAFKKRAGPRGKRKAAEEAKRAFASLTLKQSSGKLTLANENDPRQAVSVNGFQQLPMIAPPPGQE